jgi:hypothetical protein
LGSDPIYLGGKDLPDLREQAGVNAFYRVQQG